MKTELCLTISFDLYEKMKAHVNSTLPEEACGLVGGTGSTASIVFCVENELHSPVQYRMKAEEQLQSMVYLDHHQLDLLAAYHSHPTGPQHPSETDIEQWFYLDAVLLIWSKVGEDWQLNGFQVEGDLVREIEIQREFS